MTCLSEAWETREWASTMANGDFAPTQTPAAFSITAHSSTSAVCGTRPTNVIAGCGNSLSRHDRRSSTRKRTASHSGRYKVFLGRGIFRAFWCGRIKVVAKLCCTVLDYIVHKCFEKLIASFFQFRLPLCFFFPTPWPIYAPIHVEPPLPDEGHFRMTS